MFGGFQNGWPSGFTQLSDLSERVQKLKTGLEAGLQDSGLLGPGEAPALEEHNEKGPGASKEVLEQENQPSSSGHVLQEEVGNAHKLDLRGATSHHTAESSSLHGREEFFLGSEHQGSNLGDNAVDGPSQTEGDTTLEAESGWDEHDLNLEVPEEAEELQERMLSLAAPKEELPIASQPVLQMSIAAEPLAAVSQPAQQESQPAHQEPLPEQMAEPAAASMSSQEHAAAAAATASGEAVAVGLSAEPSSPIARHVQHGAEAVTTKNYPDLPNGVNYNADVQGASEHAIAAPEDGHDTNEEDLGSSSTPNGMPDMQAVGPSRADEQSHSGAKRDKEACGKSKEQIRCMTLEDIQAWAIQLQATLQTREVQLERKFEEVVNMQEVTQQLMARNEELARKAAKASEEDIKTLTDEYEARLGAAERKVYALSKERDMLKRGSEKLSSATDLIKEKDNIIAQVMAEGEQLSKKQLAQESTIKKLRQQLKDAEFLRKETSTEAAVERQKLESLLSAKQKAESELAAARQVHKAELEAEKAHYEGLLGKSRAAQVEAENRAATTAKEGLSRKLKEAEMHAEMLTEQLADLQLSMERQRSAADLREDMLKRELADMERRHQEAEARHEELTGKLPDATRPLLRQIEGMQRTAEAHAQAWQAAEQALQSRLNEAEGRAAAAAEKERLASERLHSANSRISSLAAALDALREDCAEMQSNANDQEEELRTTRQRCQRMEGQLTELQAKLAKLEEERMDLERSVQARIDEERTANLQALAAAENHAASLEERLRMQDSSSSGAASHLAGTPPAMAGPGFKWVLAREGEDAQAAQQRQSAAASLSARQPYMGAARATAPELERLRDALQQKEEQVASYQATISQLEATRDSLAEELVSLSQAAEHNAGAWRDLERTRQEHSQTHQKLAACTELLGEREERLLELEADIADMKSLYKEQIEFVLEQLSASRSPSAAASSVSSWVPGPERQ